MAQLEELTTLEKGDNMRVIGENIMFLTGEDGEAEAKLAGSIIDATKSVQKLHYANEVMSSLLAKISIYVANDKMAQSEIVAHIRVLLEWYDMYQAGIMSADITGTKLSEKSKE